jgi:hypothetical protein
LPKYSSFAKISLLIIICFELIRSTSITFNKRDAYYKSEFSISSGGYNDGSIDAVKFISSRDKSFYRIEKDYASGTAIHGSLNDAQAQGYFGTSNYSSFNQGNYIQFLKSMDVVKSNQISDLYKLSKQNLPDFPDIAFEKHLINKSIRTALKENKISLKKIILDKAVDLNIIAKDQSKEIDSEKLSLKDIENIIRAEAQIVENSSRWAQGLKGRPLAQTFVGVKYHLSKSEKPLFTRFGYDSIGQTGQIKILKNRYNLPLGLTFDTLISEQEFMKLSTFQKDIMSLRAAVINPINKQTAKLTSADSLSKFDFPVYNWLIKNRRIDTLAVKYFSNSEIQGEIFVSKKKLLVLAFPFDDSWNAKVDGKPTNLVITNFGLTGLWLDTGKHTVELHYTPPYFMISLIISLISLTVYILLIFKDRLILIFSKKSVVSKI